jgi:hypothetical protein
MKLAVVAGVLLLVIGASAAATTTADDPLAAQEAFVLRLDRMADALPAVLSPTDDLALQQLAKEILPFTGYEHLTAVVKAPTGHIQYAYWSTPDMNFHVLGTAACIAGTDVTLNARTTNGWSSWFGRPEMMWALTHELIHMQGGPFCTGTSEALESATQIATVEVMSAMVEYGDTRMLLPLLTGLRDMGISALESTMPAAQFEQLWNSVYASDGPLRKARWDKANRHWAADPLALNDLLTKYYAVPWKAILGGIATGSVSSVQVLCASTYSGYAAPTACAQPLEFDDPAYLFAAGELEAIVSQIADRLT